VLAAFSFLLSGASTFFFGKTLLSLAVAFGLATCLGAFAVLVVVVVDVAAVMIQAKVGVIRIEGSGAFAG
jgi:hypothetical protein